MAKKRQTPPQQPEAPAIAVETDGISARKVLLGAIVLVLLTVFVYIPGMQADFIWDDNLLLTHNRLMRADDGIYRFWFTTDAPDYLPLTWSTLWLEWRWWGEDATGYHVTNTVMHAIGVLLLWVVLHRLRIPGAWLAALIFAVHPVNVEPVKVQPVRQVYSDLFQVPVGKFSSPVVKVRQPLFLPFRQPRPPHHDPLISIGFHDLHTVDTGLFQRLPGGVAGEDAAFLVYDTRSCRANFKQ